MYVYLKACDKYITSMICVAWMDFSEQYHTEGQTWIVRYNEKSVLSKTYQR